MGNKNKLKMSTNNDKGCCFCLPSFISLILLAIFDILVITVSILGIVTFGDAKPYQAYLSINIALGVWQIIAFILFLIWRDAAWTRFTIFFSHVVSLIWMSVFYILCIFSLVPTNCNNNPGDTCGLSDFLIFVLSACLIV